MSSQSIVDDTRSSSTAENDALPSQPQKTVDEIPGECPDSNGLKVEAAAPEADGKDAKAVTPEADGKDAKAATPEADGKDAKAATPEADGKHAKAATPEADGEDAKAATPEADGKDAKTATPEADGKDAKTATPDTDAKDSNKNSEQKSGERPLRYNADVGSQIVRQVEYYFSDANLLRDKFMRTELEKNGGWMDADVLLSFNRLKALTTDSRVLLDSLSKSNSGLLEVDIEGKRIRRDPSGPPPAANKVELNKRTFERTVFVDGFPLDAKANEIIDFFVDRFHTDDVKLRKKIATKEFLGSTFVVFSTREAASHFIQSTVNFKDNELRKEFLEDFQKNRASSLNNQCKLDRVLCKQAATPESAPVEECTEDAVEERMIPGSVLFIDGLPESCTREILKEKFNDHIRVYADYNRGDKQAWLRFATPNSAKPALDAVLKENDGKLAFGEIVPTKYSVLEGDDERKYWKDVVQRIQDFKRKRKMSKRSGGRINLKRPRLMDKA